MTTIPHDEINDLTLKEAVDSHAQRSDTFADQANVVIKQPYSTLAPRMSGFPSSEKMLELSPLLFQ
jgi:hypothetical protein